MSLPTAKNPIAYFSLEFGIDSNIPTYAGGLGILAADTLLEASEKNLPMVGIGMMYKGRKFIQKISPDGWQYEEATPFRLEGSSCFRRVELLGKPVRFQVQIAEERVWIEAYQQRVGENVVLYLLTADVEGNSDYWRNLFDEIYWGNDEEQIKERVFFGVGGISLLQALKIKPSMYHFQEGRPALATLALFVEEYQKEKLPFSKILEKVKSKIVYTNHTLVASGIHSYDTSLMKKYIQNYADACSTDVENILQLGVESDGRFHTTRYALNISAKASGVSKPHTDLAKKRWGGYSWNSITNGVHMKRWQKADIANPSLSDSDLWKLHLEKKKSLEREVRMRIGIGYDPNWLVLSWARRISGYKRLGALFENTEKLVSTLSDPNRPAILLIAGKAHPGDSANKELLHSIIEKMKGPLSGHCLFVHNYDIALATEMVCGSDVWINIPEPQKEASGTSGMKAISNGVLPLTTLEGWASEVDWNGVGWSVGPKDTADQVYDTVKSEILEAYYSRDEDGTPSGWVEKMRKAIAISNKYSTERMLNEYIKKLYE